MADVPKKPRQIAFPHRLTLPKDPLMALNVLGLLKDEGYSMVCAGSGELEDAAKARASELGLSVTFAGGMSRDETLKLIQESEVMLMTSLWEGFPMTPLEAMALGTPVVASSVCGIPEMVDSGRDGLLAGTHSADAFAAAIRQLNNVELRDKIIQAGRAKVRETFTWEHTFQKHLELYKS
jgi:glycosyltransferase involved in cell wall biosynthesis